MSKIDIEEIKSLLPHRYPFLMIDRILDLTPGESITAIRNVTINEPQFLGHFPKESIMPGVFIIEAMAQASGILAFKTADNIQSEDVIYYLVGVDKTRFKRPVVPGDQLRMEIKLLRHKRNIWVFEGKAYVLQQIAAETELMCTVKAG